MRQIGIVAGELYDMFTTAAAAAPVSQENEVGRERRFQLLVEFLCVDWF